MKLKIFLKRLVEANQHEQYTWLIELLAGENRPICDFIRENPNSKIPFIIAQFPESGLLEYVEKDIGNPTIHEIAKDPDKLKLLGGEDADLQAFMDASTKRMTRDVKEAGEAVAKVLEQEPVMIHMNEYWENFHPLFNGDDISPEESGKLVSAWLGVTRSATSTVNIVNDDGRTVFKHPGLFGKPMIDGSLNSWENFTKYSKVNQEKIQGMKDDYQKDYMRNYKRVLEVTRVEVNKVNLARLRVVNEFFSHYKGDGDMSYLDVMIANGKRDKPEPIAPEPTPTTTPIKATQTPVKEEDEEDWDIF